MKTLTTFILAGAIALLAQPNQLDLRQDPPTAVQSERVSSAYTGTSGATTYYYWVVTRYPIGFIVPTSPVVVGGASALGGGNSVALGWPAMTGASSYDVLRTTTNAAPSSCTCAVVLATTGTTLTDNGGALSAWPPGGLNSAGVAQAELQINNRDAGSPYITLAVRNAQRTLNYQLGILKNGAAPSYVPGGFIQPYANQYGRLACVDSAGADCLNITVNVQDYGAVCDGATDDTAAIQLAIAAGGQIVFPAGTCKITSILSVDTANAALAGIGGVTIDATSITSGAAIELYSTATYGEQSTLKTWPKVAVQGIALKGDATSNAIGYWIGKTGAQYAFGQDITLENVSVYGFDQAVVFRDNAWRTRFSRCGFENIKTYFVYFNNASNAGELMRFDDCSMLNGAYSAGMYLNYGQWYFKNLSFPAGGDDGFINLVNSANFACYGCNFETQPQSADHVLLKVNDNSHAVIRDSMVLVNETDYSTAYFEANGGGTLELVGNQLPLYDYLQSETDAGIRALVKGTSTRVLLNGNVVYGGGSTDIAKWAVVGKGATAIYNGDAEVNSVAGWTVTTFGTPGGTFANVTTSPKTGTRHYEIVSPALGGAQGEQKVTVGNVGGRVAIMGFWVKAISGTGTLAYPLLNFYGATGNLISSYGAIAVTDVNAADWAWLGQSTVIPAGTQTIGVAINGVEAASGSTLYYDDVVVNIL